MSQQTPTDPPQLPQDTPKPRPRPERYPHGRNVERTAQDDLTLDEEMDIFIALDYT